MPPADYGYGGDPFGGGYEDPNAAPAAAPAAPARFSRDKLDETGKKIYDQLMQQREQLQKTVGISPYTDALGLRPEESIALMAEEIQSTGVTDIYKVKRQNVRTPLQYVNDGESEYYVDPSGRAFAGKIQRDDKGNYYGESEQLVNTQTGQPLTTSVGRPEFQTNPNMLSDYRLQSRTFTGTGVQFAPDGTPVYFSTTYKRPSDIQEFLSGAAPVLGIAASLLAGPAGYGLLGSAGAGALGGGISGLARSGGDLEAALKGAALGGLGGYAMQQLGPSFDAASALETQLAAAPAMGDLSWMDLVSPSQLEAIGTGPVPGLDQISFGVPSPSDFAAMEAAGYDTLALQPPSDLTFEPAPAQVPSDTVLGPLDAQQIDVTPLSGEVTSEFTPDELLDEALAAEATAPVEPFDITDVVPGTAAPVEPFDITDVVPGTAAPVEPFDITDVVPGTAESSALDAGMDTYPTVPSNLGGTPAVDTGLGDPTSAPGGMPKDALDAGMDLYPTVPSNLGGPPTFDPASALETQLAPPGAGAGIGLPAALSALGADAKALLGTAGGRLLLSGLATLAASRAGGGGGTTGAGPQGWSGEIPRYQAVRERVPFRDTARRPGEYGRRYFSDTAYVPLQSGEAGLAPNIEAIAAATEAAKQQAAGLASLPTRPVVEKPVQKYMAETPSIPAVQLPAARTAALPALPTYENEPGLQYNLPDVYADRVPTIMPAHARRPDVTARALAARGQGLAAGGIAQGRYLNGSTDGMEDKISANIDGKQPARLSHGEFVIPADVVSHLGNGNSESGAKRLYDMMDRIRRARTGTTKQGKQIKPERYLPV